MTDSTAPDLDLAVDTLASNPPATDAPATVSLSQSIIDAALAMSFLEVIAVILGFAYLILAMRQNSLCWYAAFGSTAIFVYLFFDVSLLMESALNIYYLVMAVYGWWVWNHGGNDNTSLPVTTWSATRHALAIGGILGMTFASGFLLSEHTTAVLPYLDSFTTWGAILTTYMVAKKVLENWIYWIVIDLISVYLYVDRALYLVALQMAIYVIMCFFGYKAWLDDYRSEQAADARLQNA